VGLVYEGRSGRPYSYIFYNDANGDGRSGNDLFYVPKGPGDVLFGSPSSSGSSRRCCDGEEVLRLAGAHPNWPSTPAACPGQRFRAGWVNTFDVRISQELPGFMKGHKSEIWLDIQNVGNLLNKKWGNITTTASGQCPCGQPAGHVQRQVRVQQAVHRCAVGQCGC
jgi:hypothetical protein